MLVVPLAVGCAASGDVEEDVQWLDPSPALGARIDAGARRLPWSHGMERVELIRWFAAVGEPAYPTLLALVLDPRKEVSCAALAALGATGDSRLVDPLWSLPWPEADEVDLALERARTLLRLGDWRMAPPLIDGLRDERLLTRALCAQALFEATAESFGYDPRAAEDDREEAIRRWEYWLWERTGSRS
ncbi:MAG: hypothetical protein QF724_03400 [Planctomycetota bacterium]|nr:hypothetical protein [Planctomycetota bacterium]MDP6837958.1 hypothetical protein [Planctomycetota bacterium]MDP6954453.1 hypothetical protein [Planctomycetota bacterium]